jgi:ADP-ribose pyrophosphatase YjhB (NUDIX family)
MLPSSPQAAPLLGDASHSNSSAKEARSFCTPLRLRIALVAYLLAAVLSWLYVVPVFLQSVGPRADSPPPTPPLVDTFPGAPWRTSQTVSSTLLLSDKRMRVESHTVRSESGALMDNWIWMDVVDHINVVPYVLSPVPTDPQLALRWNKWREGHFVVFRQRKYGLRDESLAVAGGQVEMQRNEAPLEAAKRELAEEMFLTAPPPDAADAGTGGEQQQEEDSSWVDLGSYRVNVNRGHGTVSCFLLADARPLAGTSSADLSAEFKVDELERQQLVRLSVPEMQRAVRAHGVDAAGDGSGAGAGPGAFAEIKWQATAAMALDEILRRAEEEDRRLADSSSSTLLLRGGGSPTSHETTPSSANERRGRAKTRQQQPQQQQGEQTPAPTIPDAADEPQQPQHPQARVPVRPQPPLRQRRTAPPPHRLSTRPEPLGSPPSPAPASAATDDEHQNPPIRGRTSRSAPRHTPDSLPPELEAAVKLDQAQPHA